MRKREIYWYIHNTFEVVWASDWAWCERGPGWSQTAKNELLGLSFYGVPLFWAEGTWVGTGNSS